jgi:hypothetical protein
VTWRCTGIGRYRYGSCALWTLHDDLAGGVARHFADQVDLFFGSGETALAVDLRRVGLVDSLGAAALTLCHDTHPGLRLVGRPAGWHDLTAPVRRSLLGLDALPDLEAALGSAPIPPPTAEQRRHPRFLLQLPVELLAGGKRAPAALRDISRGGVRLAQVHERCHAALRAGGSFGILGLMEDPLGREIAGGFTAEPVPAAPVRAAAAAGFGASFFAPPPPV